MIRDKIIKWTPTEVENDTYAVTVKLKDGDGKLSSIGIIAGPTYETISINPFNVLETVKVGDTIGPDSSYTIKYDCSNHGKGGYGKLSYSAMGLPTGLYIDSSNGQIYGSFETALTEATIAIITVTDELLNSASAELKITSVEQPLSFTADYVFTLPTNNTYGYVGDSITAIDFSPYVSGGTEPYIYSLISGSVKGLQIDGNTGILTGKFTESTDTATNIQIQVKDSNGATAISHVIVNRILSQFVINNYDYDMPITSGKTSYNFLMDSTKSSLLPIAVGTKTDNCWADLSNSVSGGLPYDEGKDTKHYKFESYNLMPNFVIGAANGKITGIPTVGSASGYAKIKVSDANGRYAIDLNRKDASGNYLDYMLINISNISSAFMLNDGQGIMTLPEEPYNKQIYDPNASGEFKEYNKAEPYYAELYLDDISTGGTWTTEWEKFTTETLDSATTKTDTKHLSWTPTDFPKNVLLSMGYDTEIKKVKISLSWTYNEDEPDKKPLEDFEARTSTFYIKDDNSTTQKIAITVNIGRIYPKFSWGDSSSVTEVKQEESNATWASGQPMTYYFKSLVGGKPNYKFTDVSVDGGIPSRIRLLKSDNNIENAQGSGFVGTLTAFNTTTARIQVQDAFGSILIRSFKFPICTAVLSISSNNNLQQYTFLVNVTDMDNSSEKLRPFTVTGGSGTYKIEPISGHSELVKAALGGLSIENTKDGKDCYLTGKVTSYNRTINNLAGHIQVTDLVTGQTAILVEDCYLFNIFEKPELAGQQSGSGTEGNPTIITGATSTQSNQSYGPFFNTKGNTYITKSVGSEHVLPNGYKFNNEYKDILNVTGCALNGQVKPSTTELIVTTDKNPWTPEQTLSHWIRWDKIEGPIILKMCFGKDGTGSDTTSQAIVETTGTVKIYDNNDNTKSTQSRYSGGTGNYIDMTFTSTQDIKDCSLIQEKGSWTFKYYFPEVVNSSFIVNFTIKDDGGNQATSMLIFTGVYEPLKNPFNDASDPITINTGFEKNTSSETQLEDESFGGKKPYKFELNSQGKEMADKYFQKDTFVINDIGIAKGTVKAYDDINKNDSDAVYGLTVTDSNGSISQGYIKFKAVQQVESLKSQCGENNPYIIPEGYINTSFGYDEVNKIAIKTNPAIYETTDELNFEILEPNSIDNWTGYLTRLAIETNSKGTFLVGDRGELELSTPIKGPWLKVTSKGTPQRSCIEWIQINKILGAPPIVLNTADTPFVVNTPYLGDICEIDITSALTTKEIKNTFTYTALAGDYGQSYMDSGSTNTTIKLRAIDLKQDVEVIKEVLIGQANGTKVKAYFKLVSIEKFYYNTEEEVIEIAGGIKESEIDPIHFDSLEGDYEFVPDSRIEYKDNPLYDFNLTYNKEEKALKGTRPESSTNELDTTVLKVLESKTNGRFIYVYMKIGRTLTNSVCLIQDGQWIYDKKGSSIFKGHLYTENDSVEHTVYSLAFNNQGDVSLFAIPGYNLYGTTTFSIEPLVEFSDFNQLTMTVKKGSDYGSRQIYFEPIDMNDQLKERYVYYPKESLPNCITKSNYKIYYNANFNTGSETIQQSHGKNIFPIGCITLDTTNEFDAVMIYYINELWIEKVD